MLFGNPVENANYWSEHGKKMDAFWPFGTWNREAMTFYGASEEVLAPDELDNEDADNGEDENEAAEGDDTMDSLADSDDEAEQEEEMGNNDNDDNFIVDDTEDDEEAD